MSVLVNGVRTSQVVISPLLRQTTLSLAFVSSNLGCALPSSVTIAVDCGPIESLSARFPCTVSFDQQTAVSLGIDWIESVRKWYFDHGFRLPRDVFGLRDLLCPTPLGKCLILSFPFFSYISLDPGSSAAIPAMTAVPTALLNPALSLGSSPFRPPPPHPVDRGANPYRAFALRGSEGSALHHHTHAYAPYTNHSLSTNTNLNKSTSSS
ncbi:hypothetical protein B0H11DRAFT_2278391, partial [Mycena galericulata]